MDSWQWDYYENSTTLEWSTSWSKYEELIDDWLDLTELEAGKRGQTLKNRLVGDEKMHKGLLNRELLRTENGVKYFRDTLRPHFIKGAQSVRHRRNATALDPNSQETRDQWHATQVANHERLFPFSDN